MFGLIFTSLMCELVPKILITFRLKVQLKDATRHFLLIDSNLSAAWTMNIELCFVRFPYGLSFGYPTQEVHRDKESNAIRGIKETIICHLTLELKGMDA
jgi:hypothetical protein